LFWLSSLMPHLFSASHFLNHYFNLVFLTSFVSHLAAFTFCASFFLDFFPLLLSDSFFLAHNLWPIILIHDICLIFASAFFLVHSLWPYSLPHHLWIISSHLSIFPSSFLPQFCASFFLVHLFWVIVSGIFSASSFLIPFFDSLFLAPLYVLGFYRSDLNYKRWAKSEGMSQNSWATTVDSENIVLENMSQQISATKCEPNRGMQRHRYNEPERKRAQNISRKRWSEKMSQKSCTEKIESEKLNQKAEPEQVTQKRRSGNI